MPHDPPPGARLVRPARLHEHREHRLSPRPASARRPRSRWAASSGPGHERRDEDHHERIHAGVASHDADRLAVLRRPVADASMSTGLATLASAGQQGTERRPGRLRSSVRDLETVGYAGVGAENPRSAGVGEDRPPGVPWAGGWVASSEGDVEHLLEPCRCGSRPACRNSASTVTSAAASMAPVCEPAARLPAGERPLFTATIGFGRARPRRAIRENLRGFPKDSRYSRIDVRARVLLPVAEQVVAGDASTAPPMARRSGSRLRSRGC